MSKAVVIAFIAGAVVGGVGTFMATKKVLQDFADEQVKSVKDHYKKWYENRIKEYEEEHGTLKNNDGPNTKTFKNYKSSENEFTEVTEEASDNHEEKITQEERDFAKKWAEDHDGAGNYTDEEIKTYEKYANAYMKSKNKIQNEEVDPEPYVISSDRYGEYVEYTCINLTYYAGDLTLADDRDELVDFSYVGDGLDHFDEDPNDPDTVFVRNEKLMVDYEINRDYRSYSEMIGY